MSPTCSGAWRSMSTRRTANRWPSEAPDLSAGRAAKQKRFDPAPDGQPHERNPQALPGTLHARHSVGGHPAAGVAAVDLLGRDGLDLRPSGGDLLLQPAGVLVIGLGRSLAHPGSIGRQQQYRPLAVARRQEAYASAASAQAPADDGAGH